MNDYIKNYNRLLNRQFNEAIEANKTKNGWYIIAFEDKFARYFYLNGRVTARLFYDTLEGALKIQS